MRRRTIVGALTAAGVAAGLALGPSADGGRADSPPRLPGPALERAPGVPQADAAATLAQVRDLTLPQLVGQRLIASYTGEEPPDQLVRMIERGRIAGVIFFGDNINEDKALISDVISQLQEEGRQAGSPLDELPLLMMTDQEGGEVRRLPGAPTSSALEIGEAEFTSGRKARATGVGAGENLASVGINLNLAPVLGVQRSRGGFLGQFQRSYGPNRRRVALYSSSFIAGLQSEGVAATAKHFPGLGAARANQNTDVRPVTIHHSRRALRSIDEYPYYDAVAAGTELVMLNHARYPALDRRRPASLSSTIVRGELRQRLGFDGVTITDALNAGALEDFGNTRRRSVLATRAGNDLLLLAVQSPSEAAKASQGLRDALRSGRLARGPFERAAGRVLELREGLAAEPR